jgi:hypothetical protein
LPIDLVVNAGVVGVIVRCVDAVLDEWPDSEGTKILTEPVAVIALVSSENSQLARVLAGELLTDLSITSLSGGRTVKIKDRLRFCIDELRRFKRLNAVIRSPAVERDADGYLQVLLDPDRNAGEVGYLDVRQAIKRVDADESYRSVASDVPNLARTTLVSIHQDVDRRQWYLGAEADDERVAAALDPIET